MTRPPHAAAFQAFNARLTVPNTEVWSVRAYPGVAPASTPRPYTLYWQIGGGYLPSRGLLRAEIVIGVKTVANTLAVAFDAAGRLHDLLHDQGVLETDTPLNGGDDWNILTSTVEGTPISLRETVDGVPVFHEGLRLRLFMEERP
jgi:hypothetical protein